MSGLKKLTPGWQDIVNVSWKVGQRIPPVSGAAAASSAPVTSPFTTTMSREDSDTGNCSNGAAARWAARPSRMASGVRGWLRARGDTPSQDLIAVVSWLAQISCTRGAAGHTYSDRNCMC